MSRSRNEKKKSDTRRVREIADSLCKRLNSLGYHILRYDAPYSTYLKIDAGVCHSIRISNHKSKKQHLSYRYNIMISGILDGDYVAKDNKGCTKYYAREESVKKIISLIESNRFNYINRYGKFNYYSLVLNNLKDNKDNKNGFWFKAKTVFSINSKAIEYKDEVYIKRIARLVRKLKP